MVRLTDQRTWAPNSQKDRILFHAIKLAKTLVKLEGLLSPTTGRGRDARAKYPDVLISCINESAVPP